MHLAGFACVLCGKLHEASLVYQCSACGGSLDAVYDYDRLFRSFRFAEAAGGTEKGIWRYAPLLPVLPSASPVSLGEGNTPLLKSRYISKFLNIENLWFKNETVNPTLSFKDRAQAVGATVARQLGSERIVCASTGNTGVAAAAYTARAGLPCTVFVPAGTPEEKLGAIRAYGAKLAVVAGNYGDAYAEAGRAAAETGAFNLTSTYLNPYSIEGNKTLAYEIFAQLGDVPDWIVIPVGAGPLLDACFKGFRELMTAGASDRLPRMAGAQAEGCAPIARAYEAGEDEVRPWGLPRTIASGIADPLASYPADGTRTLRTIRESGGAAVAVAEEEILELRPLLSKQEGILAEASAVVAVAGAAKLGRQGRLLPGQRVVTVVTGHGLKDMTATK